jgi:hypothetical protein
MIDLSKLRIGRNMPGKALRKHLQLKEVPLEHTVWWKDNRGKLKKKTLTWVQVGPDLWSRTT